MTTKENYPKYRKAIEDIKNGKIKIEFVSDSFLYLHYDPRITVSDIYKYKVNLRKGKKWVIKENAKQIDGKIFSFLAGWEIEKGIYKGDMAMIPADNNYPLGAPDWISLKDLELVSITHFDEPIAVAEVNENLLDTAEYRLEKLAEMINRADDEDRNINLTVISDWVNGHDVYPEAILGKKFDDNVPEQQITNLIDALEPIIKAVAINDSDTLSSLTSDDKIIWSASGSWSAPVTITLGNLRKIADLCRLISKNIT